MFSKRRFSLAVFIITLLIVCCNTETRPVQATLPDSVATKPVSVKQSYKDSLPKPIGYINDYEGLFTAAEKDSLKRMIKLFEKETTIQMAVITMDSTMTTAETLDETTLQIARAWSFTQKNKNYSIVIGVSKQFRKMRIQNGYGIVDVLSDEATKKIIDEDFIPSFKQGNYYDGIKKGLLSLMQKLREKYTA